LVGYDGAVKLGDFGIARAQERVSDTRTGALKGKYAYMAPEYIAGQDIDRRADIFALGAMLYECLTCKAMFSGATDFSVLERIKEGVLRHVRNSREDVPQEIDTIIARACARDPEERYQWASELEADLEPFLITDSGRSLYGAKNLTEVMSELYGDALQEDHRKLARLIESYDPDSYTSQRTQPLVRADDDVWQQADTQLRTRSEVEQGNTPTDFDPVLDKTLTDTHSDTPQQIGEGGARSGLFVAIVLSVLAVAGLGWWWGAQQEKSKPEAHTPVERTLTVESKPPGAAILLGTRVVGTTPHTLPLPMSQERLELELSFPGLPPKRVNVEFEKEEAKKLISVVLPTKDEEVGSGSLPEAVQPEATKEPAPPPVEGSLKDVKKLQTKISAQMRRMQEDNIPSAMTSARRALALARSGRVSRATVHRKLADFNKGFDRVTDAALKADLTRRSVEINEALAGGQLKTANRRLNQALKLMK
jgi:serine/threonine protein kinase